MIHSKKCARVCTLCTSFDWVAYRPWRQCSIPRDVSCTRVLFDISSDALDAGDIREWRALSIKHERVWRMEDVLRKLTRYVHACLTSVPVVADNDVEAQLVLQSLVVSDELV